MSNRCDLCGFSSDNHKEMQWHSDSCACGNVRDCSLSITWCTVLEDNGEKCGMGLCDIDCEEWHRFRTHFLDVQCRVCNEFHLTRSHIASPERRVHTRIERD